MEAFVCVKCGRIKTCGKWGWDYILGARAHCRHIWSAMSLVHLNILFDITAKYMV